MAWPLRSTPITGASPLLRASPPTHPASVLSTSQFLLLGGPSHHPHGRSYKGGPSHVPYSRSRPGSRRLHAGHHLANRRAPARLIPGTTRNPGFDVMFNHLDTSSAIHSRSPSWSPPDASGTPSPHRSPPRPHDRRSMRRLKPPPQGDSEGPTFISCTAPPSATITYTSRPPTFVAHQVLIIAPDARDESAGPHDPPASSRRDAGPMQNVDPMAAVVRNPAGPMSLRVISRRRAAGRTRDPQPFGVSRRRRGLHLGAAPSEPRGVERETSGGAAGGHLLDAAPHDPGRRRMTGRPSNEDHEARALGCRNQRWAVFAS